MNALIKHLSVFITPTRYNGLVSQASNQSSICLLAVHVHFNCRFVVFFAEVKRQVDYFARNYDFLPARHQFDYNDGEFFGFRHALLDEVGAGHVPFLSEANDFQVRIFHGPTDTFLYCLQRGLLASLHLKLDVAGFR